MEHLPADVRDVFHERLGGFVAEYAAEGGVGGQEPAVEGGLEDAFGGVLEDVAVFALGRAEALDRGFHGPAEAFEFPAQAGNFRGVSRIVPQAHARGVAFQARQGNDDPPAYDQAQGQGQGGVEAQDAHDDAYEGPLQLFFDEMPGGVDFQPAKGGVFVADAARLADDIGQGRLFGQGGGPPGAVPGAADGDALGVFFRDHHGGDAFVAHDAVHEPGGMVLFQIP